MLVCDHRHCQVPRVSISSPITDACSVSVEQQSGKGQVSLHHPDPKGPKTAQREARKSAKLRSFKDWPRMGSFTSHLARCTMFTTGLKEARKAADKRLGSFALPGCRVVFGICCEVGRPKSQLAVVRASLGVHCAQRHDAKW